MAATLLAALVLAAGLFAVLVPPGPAPLQGLAVSFLDVGQGDATLLQGPDFTILIDAGRHDRDDVVPHLRRRGVRALDLVIVTHPHADHIGQLPAVLDAFKVREVWMSGDVHTSQSYERALDALLASGAGYHEPRAGEVHQVGSLRIEVVNPAELTGDLHEGSVAVRAVFGEVAFLFTGDAEAHTEAAMISRGHELRAHVLQLGHHGSQTSSSSAFLEAVAPELAVYSAGEGNPYGHPHPEALARLRSLGVTVLGTDVRGTITVTTDGRTYHVETER